MFVHIYRVGESDSEGLHESTTRVTVFTDPATTARFYFTEPCLVLGTLPKTTALPLSKVRWFWVEED